MLRALGAASLWPAVRSAAASAMAADVLKFIHFIMPSFRVDISASYVGSTAADARQRRSRKDA
jgi:hypothetical protein